MQVDDDKKQGFERFLIEAPNHNTTPVPMSYHSKAPTCMVLSMEEGILKRMKVFENKIGRRDSKRKAHLGVCLDHNCIFFSIYAGSCIISRACAIFKFPNHMHV